MKGWKKLLVALPFALIGGHASAQTISSSPHNLASGNPLAEDKNELCVYCHTPHGARLDIDAPLWNKPATNSVYTSYSSSTLDGDIATTGSVSIACLTCHDGTQAVDAVINAPGTGAGDGFMIGDGTTGQLATFANLGTDLTNDHPIGIRYGNYAGNPQIDPDFVAATSAIIGGTEKWWVNTTGGAATREKTDMILYTRTADATPRVECASCHDPHVGDPDDSVVNNPGSDISFMRISNENSDVCLACHAK